MSKLNLNKLPKLSDADIAFSTIRTDMKMLAKAESLDDIERWDSYAMDLFFNGGKLTYRKELTDGEISKGSRYLKAFLSSFEPKHEHKMLIAGLILSELAVHPDAIEVES